MFTENISTQYLPRVEATLRPMSWVTSRMLEAAATVSSLLSSSTCVALTTHLILEVSTKLSKISQKSIYMSSVLV